MRKEINEIANGFYGSVHNTVNVDMVTNGGLGIGLDNSITALFRNTLARRINAQCGMTVFKANAVCDTYVSIVGNTHSIVVACQDYTGKTRMFEPMLFTANDSEDTKQGTYADIVDTKRFIVSLNKVVEFYTIEPVSEPKKSPADYYDTDLMARLAEAGMFTGVIPKDNKNQDDEVRTDDIGKKNVEDIKDFWSDYFEGSSSDDICDCLVCQSRRNNK